MSTKVIYTEKKIVHLSKILYNIYIPPNDLVSISLVKSGFYREIQVVEEFWITKNEFIL